MRSKAKESRPKEPEKKKIMLSSKKNAKKALKKEEKAIKFNI